MKNLINKINTIIQKAYASHKVRSFCRKKKFKEAMIILKYVKATGNFPHGDEEYNKILGYTNN